MINIARGTALASSEGMNDNNTAVAVGRSNESSNISTSSSNGTRIVVEGCGLSEVNGTYNRRLNTYNGAPVYVKHGTNSRGHGIYRSLTLSQRWYIGNWDVVAGKPFDFRETFYLNDADASCETPPEDGWVVDPFFGAAPAPTCRRLRNSNESDATERVRGMQGPSTAVQSDSASGNNSTTVKISYQEGKLLGFVLHDSESDDGYGDNIVSLSGNSIVFRFVEQLFDTANQRAPALVHPSNVNQLIEWGGKNCHHFKTVMVLFHLIP